MRVGGQRFYGIDFRDPAGSILKTRTVVERVAMVASEKMMKQDTMRQFR